MAQINNILCPGLESAEGVDILLSFTKCSSQPMQKALKLYLVNGADESTAVMMTGAIKSNFNRDLKKLNEVARKIDQYFELNYKKSGK